MNYKNGRRYVGEVLNGNYHGRGTLIDGKNTFYGEFKDGKVDGMATFEN